MSSNLPAKPVVIDSKLPAAAQKSSEGKAVRPHRRLSLTLPTVAPLPQDDEVTGGEEPLSTAEPQTTVEAKTNAASTWNTTPNLQDEARTQQSNSLQNASSSQQLPISTPAPQMSGQLKAPAIPISETFIAPSPEEGITAVPTSTVPTVRVMAYLTPQEAQLLEELWFQWRKSSSRPSKSDILRAALTLSHTQLEQLFEEISKQHDSTLSRQRSSKIGK